MNKPSGNPKILLWGFCLYAVLSLGSMATMSIAATVLLVCLLAGHGGFLGLGRSLREELRQPKSRFVFFAGLALFNACALSLLVARFFPLSFNQKTPEIHFGADLAKAWYLFWPLFLTAGLRTVGDSGRAKIIKVWLVTFAIISVVGVVQFFTGWPREQAIPGLAGRFHATLFLGHHLSVASILIFPFFAALDGLFHPTEMIKIGLSRKFIAAAIFLGALTLFFSFSRTLWVALPVGVGLFLFWNLSRRVAIPLLIVSVLAGWALTFHPAVHDRLETAMGIGTRQELWSANWEFFKLRPLTGAGWHKNLELAGHYLQEKYPGRENFVGHAHNGFLEMLGSTGALGTIAWLVWVGWVFVELFGRARRGEFLARGFFCAWLVFHINGLTQVNFWESKVLHQVMWVASLILVSAPRSVSHSRLVCDVKATK